MSRHVAAISSRKRRRRAKEFPTLRRPHPRIIKGWPIAFCSSAAPPFAVSEERELESLHRIAGHANPFCSVPVTPHTLLPAKNMPQLVPLSPQIILGMRAGGHFARYALNNPDSGSF